MKNNFNIINNRTKSNDRRWNKEYVEEKYKIDTTKPFYPFSLGDTDFKVPSHLLKALSKRINSGIYGYSFIESKFYESILEWNKRWFNVEIKKEDVILSYGTIVALYCFVRAYTNEGDKVLINTPVYGPFKEAIVDNNRICINNKLIYNNKNYEFDFELFKKQIIENKIKLFILCNPHNPGGNIWGTEVLEEIVSICKKYNVVIVSDEVHRDLVFKNNTFNSMSKFYSEYKNIIIATSTNKAFNTGGFKTSYVIIQDLELRNQVKPEFQKSRITSPCTLGVTSVVESYKSRKWLNSLIEYLERNFKYLKNEIEIHLPKLKVFNSKSSFFLWVNFSKLNTSWTNIKQKLLEKNIIVCFGDEFVDDGWDFMRINIGCSFKMLKEFTRQFILTLSKI